MFKIIRWQEAGKLLMAAEPSQINGGNLNNEGRVTTRTFSTETKGDGGSGNMTVLMILKQTVRTRLVHRHKQISEGLST
jgi:hypothetical protein